MTDLEISKALALAIGWKEEQIDAGRYFGLDRVVVCLRPRMYPNEYVGKYFDYRDWNVIGPIAEKYNCFPRKNEFGNWDVVGTDLMLDSVWNEDTPQKAIALAVIGANT